MKMDLQPAILEYLCRYHRIGLLGMGTLQWLVQRAQREKDRYLSPPSISLKYSQEEISDSKFIDFFSKKSKLSIKQASIEFEKWCDKNNEQLQKGEKVTLSGLGSFHKINDKISFQPHYKGTSFGLGLEEMLLETADHNTYTTSHPPVNPIVRQNESLNWLEMILPLILISLIGLLFYFLWISLHPEHDPRIVMQSEVPVVVEDTSENQYKDNAITLVTDSLSKKELEIIENEVDIELEEAKIISREKESTEVEFKEEEIINGDEARIVTQAKEGECIVIVGSYKNEKYAIKAKERVLSRGLTVYTEPYGDFTRVGVLFDCETKDLYRTLFQLRGDFGEDAWILKYK